MKKKKVSKDFCQECSKRVDDNDKALCCEACSIWFHIQCIKVPECVYDYMQSSGDDGGFTWQCKDCRNCGKSNTKLSISNSKEIKDLKESICDEIKEKLPVLVKDALIETSKCTGFFTKTFAEVVKQQNETVIKNAVKSTSGAAFKEGMITMSKNMEERQKRHKNLILSGIVENDITAETNSKSLKNTVFGICSRIEPRLRKEDILSCKRIGRIDITEPHVGRLVHVIMKYQDDAEMLHNWGLGRKIENNIWTLASISGGPGGAAPSGLTLKGAKYVWPPRFFGK